MTIDSLHPGVTIDAVRAATSWEPRVADAVRSTPEPSRDELRLIREELDPKGLYTR
jgi:glutaconate CoA-transferase subunit B